MELRGIDFGPILGASGVQGFFGEGYWYHKFSKNIGLDFTGCTFVAKTTTLEHHEGNAPMERDGITMKELLPKCVKVYFRKGIILNAMGLPGPGAKALLETGRWQERKNPFFISFMSVEKSVGERINEFHKFVKLLREHLPEFKAPVALQINGSCTNVGIDINFLFNEIKTYLKIGSVLNIPLVPKFNALASVKVTKGISDEQSCDAICVSNSIPWGKAHDKINWKKLFGSDVSPLAQFDCGGLSGKPLLPLVVDWVKQARHAGISKPIIAGGGILSPNDLQALSDADASSVFIGSVATLRPWNVQKIIKKAHELF